MTGQRSNQLNYVPNLFSYLYRKPACLVAFLRFNRFACVARFNPVEPNSEVNGHHGHQAKSPSKKVPQGNTNPKQLSLPRDMNCKHHFRFLAMEPPMLEIAPLQLLAIFAAETPAIPPDIGQRIADGIHVWDRQLGDLISLAHIEKGTSVAQDSTKLALLLTTCWFGAIVRRKSDPSLKLVDDLLPSLLRCGVL